MASLSKAQLKKRNNLEVLRDKFFEQNGMVNMFVGPEGQFHPAALIIETPQGQYAYEPKDTNEMESALGRISEFIDSRGAKLFFTGKYANTGKISTLPLDKLEKTSEFGGQGAKSGKQNLGLVFEKDLISCGPARIKSVFVLKRAYFFRKQARFPVNRMGFQAYSENKLEKE